MILCDIGNTNAVFHEDGKIYTQSIAEFKHYSPKQKVYYINVNPNIEQKLKNDTMFINLEPFYEIDTIYQGLGIDRIAACFVIEDGIIVDAGSAITIDVMSNGLHLGGCILPGISQTLKSFEQISPRLKVGFNSQIEINALPQKTLDAISYGIVKPIVVLIQEIAKNKNVYFTGGDGEFLSRFFQNAIYDRLLIFRSMKRLIETKGIK